MAAHARLWNEFAEDEKYHNVLRRLICVLIDTGIYCEECVVTYNTENSGSI